MPSLLDTIRQSWSWIGLQPVAVVASNLFGNVVVRVEDGTFWRICPEELSCKQIVRDESEYRSLFATEAFEVDWKMSRMVELAQQKLGPVGDDHCYYLVIPAVTGGRHDESNVQTISRHELLILAGDLAQQIKDLPDGTRVRLELKDRSRTPGRGGFLMR